MHDASGGPGHTFEFDPPNTGVQTLVLRIQCATAWNLARRILGDADAEHTSLTNAAKQFSDLISDDISSAASYNEQEWRRACLVLTYSAGVANYWLQDVIDFRESRSELIRDYAKAEAVLRQIHQPLFKINTFLAVDEDVLSSHREAFNTAAATLLRDYNRRGDDLKDTLIETARERATMLEEGPETKNLKEMVEAGVLGWSAYNILGAHEDIPLPVTEAEAVKLSRELEPYLNGDKEPNDRFYEILATITAVSTRAALLQEANRSHFGNPRNLGEEEIAFLEKFYEELEGMTPHGIVRIVPWLEGDDGPEWNPEQRRAFMSSVADGLITLSDEGIGGGQDKLPNSTQRLANGLPATTWEEDKGRFDWLSDKVFENGLRPFTESALGIHELGWKPTGSLQWLQDAVEFSDLIQHTSTDLHGGTEFSANLTLSTGHHIDNITGDVLKEPRSHLDELLKINLIEDPQIPLSDLLDVTTRNEQANYDILTGERSHPGHDIDDPRSEGMPEFKENSQALLGLYAHNWDDDGKAVAGLTDWIPEFAQGTPEQAQMAGEATVALMETLAGGEHGQPFHDTHEVDSSDHNRAVTEINPKLTESFNKIYLTYEDDFILNSKTNEYGAVSFSDEGLLLHTSGENALQLTRNTKQGFLQLLIADDDNVASIVAATELLELRTIDAAIGNTTEGAAGMAGAKVSTLRNLVHNAMIAEYDSRDMDSEDARQRAADEWQTSFNIRVAINNGLLGEIPYAGGVAASTGEVALRFNEVSDKEKFLEEWDEDARKREQERKQEWESEHGEDAPSTDFVNTDGANFHAQLQLLQIYLDRDAIDPQTLKEKGFLPDQHDVDKDPVHPAVVETVSENPEGNFPRLVKLLEEAGETSELSGGHEDWVKDYLEWVEKSYYPEVHVPKSLKQW
ncbi:hypothetical protein [Nocardiopsis sp. NPDC006938]|uniref:TPR repeat region-containing protein n=1 Tax=Nocardiopsis sp. NPDC006938 TaxID=3364337 RepID=UPI0036B2EC62